MSQGPLLGWVARGIVLSHPGLDFGDAVTAHARGALVRKAARAVDFDPAVAQAHVLGEFALGYSPIWPVVGVAVCGGAI
jgi:hypothetical protein